MDLGKVMQFPGFKLEHTMAFTIRNTSLLQYNNYLSPRTRPHHIVVS